MNDRATQNWTPSKLEELKGVYHEAHGSDFFFEGIHYRYDSIPVLIRHLNKSVGLPEHDGLIRIFEPDEGTHDDTALD